MGRGIRGGPDHGVGKAALRTLRSSGDRVDNEYEVCTEVAIR
ncbi:MAG: hypothetical protein HW413_2581 [Thermoleophilia bacterium]|nr:hypothetical protein [Thermoleophilia bacterium]